jgi:hypothetical protein
LQDVDALDVGDFANDSRGAVRSACISIYPQQQQQAASPQQQQQQHHWPWQVNPMSPKSPQQQGQQLLQEQLMQHQQKQQRQEQQPLAGQQTRESEQQQPQLAHAAAPWAAIEGIKQMFHCRSSSPSACNMAGAQQVHQPQPQQQQLQQSNRTATNTNVAAAQQQRGVPAAACQPQHLKPAKNKEQQLLTRQIMQRLQTPVKQHHTKANVQHQQQQQQHWPRPLAEAVEESIAVATVPAMQAGAAATGMADGMLAGTSSHSSSSSIRSNSAQSTARSRLAKLRERLTVETAPAGAQQQQQQQQHTKCIAGRAPWEPQTTEQQLPCQHSSAQVQHVMCIQQHQQEQQPHWQQQQQQHKSEDEQGEAVHPDASYSLRLVTVERAGRLFFHIHKAWVCAHIRAALADSNSPGELAEGLLPAYPTPAHERSAICVVWCTACCSLLEYVLPSTCRTPAPPSTVQFSSCDLPCCPLFTCDPAGLPAWLPPPTELYQTEEVQQASRLGDNQQQHAHSPSLQQQQSRPSSPFGLRGLFGGFASPRAAAAAAGGAAPGDGSSSSRTCLLSGQQASSLTSGSGCSSLSSEAQAALQAEMVKFFGLNR